MTDSGTVLSPAIPGHQMNLPEAKVPGFVLCGGRSRRMGQDKAMMEVRGRPMAVHAAEVLRSAGCSPVHLVGRQPDLKTLQWPTIDTESGMHHPLQGVVAALKHTQLVPKHFILIAACDLIHLTTDAVRKLLDHQKGCVAYDGSRVHPLLCLLPTARLKLCEEILKCQQSAHRMVQGLDRISLPPEVLANANTPDQLSER